MMDYLSTHPTCPCSTSTSHLGPRPLHGERVTESESLLQRKCLKAGVTARGRTPRCHGANRAQGNGRRPAAPTTPPHRPLHSGPPRLGRDPRAPRPDRVRLGSLDASQDGRAEGRAGAAWRRRSGGARQNRDGRRGLGRARPPVTGRRRALHVRTQRLGRKILRGRRPLGQPG